LHGANDVRSFEADSLPLSRHLHPLSDWSRWLAYSITA